MPYLIRIMADTAPDFHKQTIHLIDTAFPEFAFHGAVINKYWRNLYDRFADYQFGLFDTESNEYLALGNSFPLFWDKPLDQLPDGGIEWALVTSVEQHEQGIKPNMLCAFQIITTPTARGSGLSYKAVEVMIAVARERGLGPLIAPVRPNRKSEYPRMSMEEYLTWKREDGFPHDDWIRFTPGWAVNSSASAGVRSWSITQSPSGGSGPAWSFPKAANISSPARSYR